MPRLTDKNALGAADAADLLHVVDVDDNTGSPEGTSKKITAQNLVNNNTDVAANTAARHDAVTLNADDPTQETLNISGQEIQVNLASGATDGAMSAGDKDKLDNIEAGAQVNTVDSVNTQTGAVVLDADDISDAATTNKFVTAAEKSDIAANTAARHDAVTLNAGDTTQETLNLSGQELEVNLASATTDGAMSAGDKAKSDAMVSFERTEVSDSDYSVLSTDNLVVITALTVSRTITLPAPVDGKGFIIKDESGLASLYPLTINVVAAGTIDGLSQIKLRTDYTLLKVYSDGTDYFTAEPVKNSGQVKINTGNGVKPSIEWGGAGIPVETFGTYEYDLPLGLSSAPTTRFPRNIDVPTDADIYDDTNETFIENTVPGQANRWRCILDYSGKSQGNETGVEVRIRNTISGFSITETIYLPSERTSGQFAVELTTIADAASLPAPFGTGQGYVLEISADDPIVIELDSLTRFNTQTD